MSGLLQTKDAFRELVQPLAACPQIARSGSEEPETLAHAFSDLEESLRKFLDEQLPMLADPATQGEELEDANGIAQLNLGSLPANSSARRRTPSGKFVTRLQSASANIHRRQPSLSDSLQRPRLRRYATDVLKRAPKQ